MFITLHAWRKEHRGERIPLLAFISVAMTLTFFFGASFTRFFVDDPIVSAGDRDDQDGLSRIHSPRSPAGAGDSCRA